MYTTGMQTAMLKCCVDIEDQTQTINITNNITWMQHLHVHSNAHTNNTEMCKKR